MHEAGVPWLKRAASQNHPGALQRLSWKFVDGKVGCPRDLAIVRAYARKVGVVHADMRVLSNEAPILVANAYLNDGKKNEAVATLTDVVRDADEVGLCLDNCKIVDWVLYNAVDDEADSRALLSRIRSRCFRLGDVKYALLSSWNHHEIGEFALSKLWLELALKTKHGFRGLARLGGKGLCTWPESKERRQEIRSELREIRNSCGGCGAALEGERRKYCRGCRTYCYCNRECQKVHWARADNGHRDECKEVMCQARKIFEAIEDGTLKMPEMGK